MSHATLMETLNLGVMRYDLPLKSHRLAECPPRWWALKILEITLLWFDTFQKRIVSAWDTKVLRVLLLYLPHLQSVTWDYSGTKKCLSLTTIHLTRPTYYGRANTMLKRLRVTKHRKVLSQCLQFLTRHSYAAPLAKVNTLSPLSIMFRSV